MVKKIVDEHGARIEVVNRGGSGQGGGAIVTIVFRRLAEVSAAPALFADASNDSAVFASLARGVSWHTHLQKAC